MAKVKPTPRAGVIVHEIHGECAGVRITVRDSSGCLMFETMAEDDGHWLVSSSGFSTAWLNDFIDVHKRARKWLRKHAKPTGPDGIYGFKLKGCEGADR